MVYVFRCFNIRALQVDSNEFIRENAHQIKRVRKTLPTLVELADGNIYLFMTVYYYERVYKIGRRKNVDYKCIKKNENTTLRGQNNVLL